MVTRWKNRKNVVYVRPVAAWQSGAWSAAAAIESNLVNNAYGYQSQSGRWVDQSNRTGYGLTMSWNTLKSDPQDGAVVNLSTALLDAADENRLQRRDQRPLASRGAGLYLCAQ
ncbi:glycoporin [Klebsiella pneumoniae]|uniref:Glycoporin n=1 Tax=Klebsiella pneumoniae TaxID=573 RepID=A0A378FMZ3_KLEPN|nr:glycoporin [Klebsiella pneumoniae]